MTKQQVRLRRNFFKRCGPNIENMAAIFESLPNVGFYIKDAEGRIIAINRFNCEMCNLPNPDFAIGKRSSDLFPRSFADCFMARDNMVRKTGKPIANRRYTKVANMSVGARVHSIYPEIKCGYAPSLREPIRSSRRARAVRIQNGSRVFCKKIARFIMTVHKERLRASFIRVFSCAARQRKQRNPTHTYARRARKSHSRGYKRSMMRVISLMSVSSVRST